MLLGLTLSGHPYCDDDDAGFSDDILGQWVECRVELIVKVLELFHDVVQLHHCPERLNVHTAVHSW